jgi:hypothetical protein
MGVPVRFVTVRDDDVSRFTEPERFETAHAFLIRNRIPFNVSVIPMVSDRVLSAPDSVEGFIPARLACKGKAYDVSENGALVRSLKKLDIVEIAQHGFSHAGREAGQPEFCIEDRGEIVRRLEEGMRILERAFGKSPAFFVPPRDQVSKTALDEIRKRFSGISVSRFPHELVPVWLWPKFLYNKKRGRYLLNWRGFRMAQHPGVDFSFLDEAGIPDAGILSAAGAAKDVLVLPVHSWRFFSEGGELKKKLLSYWEDFLERLLEMEGVRFVTFSQLGNKNE